jgi:hypothetical protein
MVQLNTALNPSAHVTVNRNRVKNYDSNVYLKDGTNFEIELWNPTTSKVLASISIDGKIISEKGIILKPGQRVYLERWIDQAKKFKFSTYSVENSVESKIAISENGKVVVNFYYETIKNFYPNGSSAFGSQPFWSPSQPYYYTTDGVINTPDNNVVYGGTTQNNLFYSNTSLSSNIGSLTTSNIGSLSDSTRSKEIETGRAEQGESSDQLFISDTGDFNTWASNIIEWKILPESSKPVEVQKLRSYCTDCGTRIRANSWKFCPSCGEKL